MINLCNDIIKEDMCIERILERFYNLEKLSHHYSNKNKRYKRPKKIKKDIDNTNINDLKNNKILQNSISSIKLIKNEKDK